MIVTAIRRTRALEVDTDATTPEHDDASARFVRAAEARLDRAFRLATLLLADRAEAEDAVGDALERAWASFAHLRERDAFDAWFDRIVVNACRDRLRRRGRVRFVPVTAVDEPAAGHDAFDEVVEADATLRSIASLTEEERIVVVLHFWADLTLTAVAERTGWSVGTVKSRLHRALVRLRVSLVAEEDER